MAYIPLHHKYRPQTFADLVGQEAISTTLANALRLEKIAPAYLFTGPRGTGKTSSARILAKSLNCMSTPAPTAQPCGKCEVCSAIAIGTALDVIEIDAASNTGVDNIREIIERAQYAPVQCRYKVYTIDECLTGDSLVLSESGLLRIDDRSLLGQKVLSYDEKQQQWQWKRVLRWLDRGEKQTLVIKTNHQEIRCTGNHLIGTDRGWIKAQELKPGMKILSPLNRFCNKQNHYDPSVNLVNVVVKGTSITTWDSKLRPVVNGWVTFNAMQSHQWHTSLEEIESVSHAGIEKVYDLEIEDNHNFVANGLLVHNCHMLTTSAFNSLLKTLEEPPAHVVFILATTDPQRVLPTIISRCQRFDYRRIPLNAMVEHLNEIAKLEKIEIDPGAVTLIAQIAQGGLRDAESLLDRLSLLDGEITADRVYEAIGSVPERDLLEIVKSIASGDPETLLDRTRQILERGKEPIVVLQNLAAFYRDLTIAKTASQRPDLVPLTIETWTELISVAKTWDLQRILAGQQHLKESETQLKHSTQPQLWLEIAILGLLSIGTQPAVVAAPVATLPSAAPTAPVPTPTVAVTPQPPASIAPPPAPAPAPPPPATPNDLDETWERVLQMLLPASKDLFKSYGTLIGVSDTQATIAMKSSTMQTIASGKVPELTKVLSNICGRSMVVKLEVMGKNAPAPSKATAQSVPSPSPSPSTTIAPQPPQIERSVPESSPSPPLSPSPPPPSISTGEYLSDDEMEEDEEEEIVTVADLPTLETPTAVETQVVANEPTPPASQLLPLVPEELPTDLEFAEPPDSVDAERAIAHSEPPDPVDVELDPELQAATDNVVRLFSGEIIDRSDELFDKIVGK